MAMSDNTYQLLIVSYVLASGHDHHDVTVPVWLSPQASQQRQPHCQGSWLGPEGQAGPHCCRLLMTSCKDIGRNSPFHVGLHTLHTKQLINLNLKLPSHVFRQCHSVWRLERGWQVQQGNTILYPTSATHIVPDVRIWNQFIRYPIKIRRNQEKIDPISLYADVVFNIVPHIE